MLLDQGLSVLPLVNVIVFEFFRMGNKNKVTVFAKMYVL